MCPVKLDFRRSLVSGLRSSPGRWEGSAGSYTRTAAGNRAQFPARSAKLVFRHKFVSMAQESPSEKSISLSLTARYAPSWKTWEGIREVVQNWHDGVYFSLEKLRAVSSSRLAFHHTKEKDSLSYKAILTAENCLKLERKAAEDRDSDDQEVSGRNQTRKPGHQTFDSSVTDNGARGDDREGSIDIELGRIDYNPTRQKLTLINHDTELMRKVLLLGFSKKASNKEVIGHHYIIMHILHIVLYTFSKVLTGRICLKIKSFFIR